MKKKVMSTSRKTGKNGGHIFKTGKLVLETQRAHSVSFVFLAFIQTCNVFMYGKKLKVKLLRGKRRQAKGWGGERVWAWENINAYTYMNSSITI